MQVVIDQGFYPHTKVAPPRISSFGSFPRYGFEIEFNLEAGSWKHAPGSYAGYSTSTVPGPNRSKTGKTVSYRFAPEVLDEIEERFPNGMFHIGPEAGSLMEFRSEPKLKRFLFCDFDKILDEPPKFVSKVQQSGSGIHIHSDRRNYRPSELYRNVKFITSRAAGMRELLEKVSRRSSTTSSRYGFVPTFDYSYKGHFIEPEKGYPRINSPSTREGISLNSGHGTHEFRMFKSTTNIGEAKACLDYIDAVNWFSKDESVWAEDAAKFFDFVSASKDRFPFLYKLLK